MSGLCYYNENVPLSMEMSHADLEETTDDREYEKCHAYHLPEMVSLEVRLIPEDSLLGIVERKDKRQKRSGPKGFLLEVLCALVESWTSARLGHERVWVMDVRTQIVVFPRFRGPARSF